MPLPSNYATRTVHGEWVTFPSGEPAQGSVRFAPSVPHLTSSSDQLVIVTRAITQNLDGTGQISVTLPTTDDPDISPTGWVYTVTETFQNGEERSYDIEVPESGTGTIELATVTPVGEA